MMKKPNKVADGVFGYYKMQGDFVNCGKVQNEEFFCSGVPLFFGAFSH